MGKYFAFFISLAFAAPTTQAGIRIINGGGGYGEMTALTAFSRLRHLVKPCLQRPEACGLELRQAELLTEALGQGSFDTDRAELKFFVSTNRQLYKAEKGVRGLTISSAYLYDNEKKPKSYQEIARIVFVGWMLKLDITSESDVHLLAEKIFRQFEATEVELPLDGHEHVARAFNMRSRISADREALFMLEDDKASSDVTAALAAATGCPDAKILEIHALSFEPPAVTGHIVWQCGIRSHTGQFALDAKSWQASVFGASECEELL